MANKIGSASGWERIGNAKWKSQFLSQIETLDGFRELVEHSRDTAPNWPLELASRVADHTVQLLAQYPREELRMARLYYNTQQLIGFWRYYRELIETGISEGRISKRFPLFLVSLNPVNRNINLEAVTLSQLGGGIFIKTDRGSQAPSFTHEKLDHKQALLNGALSTKDVLDSLYGRLKLVTYHFQKTSLILYKLFLARERQTASGVWDSYKIHVFLDNFMYWSSKAGNRTSRFDFIFFANNLPELMVWLTASLAGGKQLSIKEAETFLNNQTKHYLGLSQRITLEENEALNGHKELLYYDETQNMVRLGNIPPEILEKSRSLIRNLDITSLGCPFARAKGVKLNALTEMYQYFDQLFVRILEASWEFKHLFNSDVKAATNRP